MTYRTSSVFGSQQSETRVEGFTLQTVPEYDWLKRISTGLVIFLGMIAVALGLSCLVGILTAPAQRSGGNQATMVIINAVMGLFIAAIGVVATWLITTPEKVEVLPNKKVYSLGVRITYFVTLGMNVLLQVLMLMTMGSMDSTTSGVEALAAAGPLVIVVGGLGAIVSLAGFVFWVLYMYNLMLRLESYGIAKQYMISTVGFMISCLLYGLGIVILMLSFSTGGPGAGVEGLLIIPCCLGAVMFGFSIYMLVVFIMICVRIFRLTGQIEHIHGQLNMMAQQAAQMTSQQPSPTMPTSPITPGYPGQEASDHPTSY